MKKIGKITLFAFLLFSVTGCATYVKSRPSFSAVSSISNIKIAKNITVFISEKDLASEHSVHFSLMGYLFPFKVKVGQTLKVYAEEYLGEIFNEVAFNNQETGNIFIRLAIKEFDISAFMKAAHLEIKMAVNDENNKQVLEKIYRADGEGHFPLYLHVAGQDRQVQKTAEQAFTKIFNEITRDIQQIKFM